MCLHCFWEWSEEVTAPSAVVSTSDGVDVAVAGDGNDVAAASHGDDVATPSNLAVASEGLEKYLPVEWRTGGVEARDRQRGGRPKEWDTNRARP
jgi:hypothetical protein